MREPLIVLSIILFSATLLHAQWPHNPPNLGYQCRRSVDPAFRVAGDPEFKAERISFNVSNADIRDVLNVITEQVGCDFVVEDDVGPVSVTLQVSDVPWGLLLIDTLKTKGLSFRVTDNLIIIGTPERIRREADGLYDPFEKRFDDSGPLITELVRLKNLPTCSNASPCKETSVALHGLEEIIRRRLSKRGMVDVDASKGFMVVTDIRPNLDTIKSLVELVDNKEFYDEILRDKD